MNFVHVHGFACPPTRRIENACKRQRRFDPVARLAIADPTLVAPPRTETVPAYVKATMKLIEDDLPLMFELDHEPDWSIYTPKVKFTDPITNFTGVAPYKLNIGMLKDSLLFSNGLLQIRSVVPVERKPGAWSVVTRFTLSFDARILPWKPRLVFTGTSEYVLDSTGMVYQHIDRWDSIKNQDFLSLEALRDVFTMVSSPPFGFKPPDLPEELALAGREADVLRRREKYRVIGIKSISGGARPGEDSITFESLKEAKLVPAIEAGLYATIETGENRGEDRGEELYREIESQLNDDGFVRADGASFLVTTCITGGLGSRHVKQQVWIPVQQS